MKITFTPSHILSRHNATELQICDNITLQLATRDDFTFRDFFTDIRKPRFRIL